MATSVTLASCKEVIIKLFFTNADQYIRYAVASQ